MMDRLEEATNRSAAFHIYADLCSIRNYGQVRAKFSDELRLVYFEAAPPGSPVDGRLELILPVNETESLFNLETTSRLIDIANQDKGHSVFNKVKLGITSVDHTTVYYDISQGLDSPFTSDQLVKQGQTRQPYEDK